MWSILNRPALFRHLPFHLLRSLVKRLLLPKSGAMRFLHSAYGEPGDEIT